MPLVYDRSLNLLTSSPPRYHCDTAVSEQVEKTEILGQENGSHSYSHVSQNLPVKDGWHKQSGPSAMDRHVPPYLHSTPSQRFIPGNKTSMATMLYFAALCLQSLTVQSVCEIQYLNMVSGYA